MAAMRLASTRFESPMPEVVQVALCLLDTAIAVERECKDVLLLGPQARWFRPPGEREQVDLSRRQSLRLLLDTLATKRHEEPGVGISADELFRAGWPGERIDWDSANNRVRVAIATLRKMGLRELIVGGKGGYRLSPAIAVERVEPIQGR
jgi:hypothetical protein